MVHSACCPVPFMLQVGCPAVWWRRTKSSRSPSSKRTRCTTRPQALCWTSGANGCSPGGAQPNGNLYRNGAVVEPSAVIAGKCMFPRHAVGVNGQQKIVYISTKIHVNQCKTYASITSKNYEPMWSAIKKIVNMCKLCFSLHTNWKFASFPWCL